MVAAVTVQDLIEEITPVAAAPVESFQTTLESRADLRRESQNTTPENILVGLKDTAAASVGTRMATEGQAALDEQMEANPEDRVSNRYNRPGMTTGQMGATLGGMRDGLFGSAHNDGKEWKTRSEDMREMGKGLSQDDRETLYGYTNKAAAVRALSRMKTTRERQERTALQYSGTGVRFAGALADLDVVLGPGLALRRTRDAARFITKSRFAQSRIIGASGGAQAGALVGGAQAMTDDTADEATFVMNVLMGTTLGGALGGPTGDLRGPSKDMYAAYKTAVETNDPKLTATVEAPVDLPVPSRVTATNEVLDEVADEPLMSTAGSVGAARLVPDHVKAEYQSALDNGADEADLIRILNTPAPTYAASLKKAAPTVNMSKTTNDIINGAHEDMAMTGFVPFEAASGLGTVKQVDTSKLSYLTGSGFQGALYRSKSSVANWMGRNIFESSSGVLRGEANAASLSPIYTGQIMQEVMHVEKILTSWAQKHQPGWKTKAMGVFGGATQDARRQFNRAINLERNARQMGKAFTDKVGATTNDIHVLEAAGMYDKSAPVALQRLQGFDGQTPVRGAKDIDANPHYAPQRADGSAMLTHVQSGKVTRKEIVTAMAEGLRGSNPKLKPKDAKLISEAMVARGEQKQIGADLQTQGLLEGDGADWLEATLKTSGVPKSEVKGIMKRLRGDKADRSKIGSVKSRNSVDMSIAIGDSDLQLVDMFTTDLQSDWAHYAREVGGSAALARHGIDSKAAREEWITAMQAEQRAKGEEPMHANELRAMFSNFDAGPQLGWTWTNPDAAPAAADPILSDLARLTGLAWLNKIVFAQGGEYGGMIWQAGFNNWFQQDIIRNFNKELRAVDSRLLEEFGGEFGFAVGKDHLIMNPHLELDDVRLDAADQSILQKIRKGTKEMSRVQSQINFFNTVKGHQQKTAAKMAINMIFRDIKKAMDLDGGTISDHKRHLLWNNFGINDARLLELEDLVAEGAISFDSGGFVTSLGADKWNPAKRHEFGALIMRNIDQVVQRSKAGEQDAWMSTSWGKAMTHLKTFPMQASQKQLVRLLRNSPADAMGTIVFGIMTAGIASMVRGVGSDMTAADHAKRAFAYSNATGFLPMAIDPALTMLGMDDMRFNQYGKHAEVGGMASLEWANDAIRLPGAVGSAIRGTADYDDKAALRTIPFANMIIIGDYLTSLGQATKETKDSATPSLEETTQ